MQMYSDIECRYFSEAGQKNTENVLEKVSQKARDLCISKVIIASSTGTTAFAAVEKLRPGIAIIAVSSVTGFHKPNVQDMTEEDFQKLRAGGVSVLTCQHAFGGVGRAVRNKLSTYQVDEIIAHALRIFGHGTKVAIEIALMAADAGLVRTDEDVISVGGSGKGADTALVLQPANSFRFFDLKVREIICKPRVF